MHRALIKIDKDAGVLVYRAKGHAGDAEAGKNIYCAASSILAMTLASVVTEAHENGWIDDAAVCEVSTGEAEISCVIEDPDVFGELARAYLFVLNGYRLLAASYPQYISIKSKIRV